jgi:hypothetical protein
MWYSGAKAILTANSWNVSLPDSGHLRPAGSGLTRTQTVRSGPDSCTWPTHPFLT